MTKIRSITTKSGFLVIDNGDGPPREIPIADVLRAADIPSLGYGRVPTITTLSNIIVILIRTLIQRKVLDESFVDGFGMDWDLDHLIYAFEQMGGTYHEPDLDDV